MSNIAVVVPTIRRESWEIFVAAWWPLFRKHDVAVIKVEDGEIPRLVHTYPDSDAAAIHTVEQIMGEDADLICNFTPAVRNLGFAFIAKHLPDVEYILTLDDDVLPQGDTIQDHLDILKRYVSTSWMNTAILNDFTEYMRGHPYKTRFESEVVLSHGVWYGVADWDAPTQLVMGAHRHVDFYRGPIPKGIQAPICGMNVMFKRKALPYVYYAPVVKLAGAERFDDIWGFIETKRDFDHLNWALVSGYAAVRHERASNVIENLLREPLGIKLNEGYWHGDEKHPWFAMFKNMRERWQDAIVKEISGG